MTSPAAFLNALASGGRVLLTGPIGPDGDSLGACLALQGVLARHGVHADVAGRVPWRYRWMPGIERLIPDHALTGPYDAVVVLDGDRHRLTPPVARLFADARLTAIVDHHASTRPEEYDLAWVEPRAASACQMLLGALPCWAVPLDPELATWLYTGLVFDTGGLRHSNTTPAVLRDAAALLEHGVDHAAVVAQVLHARTHSGLRLSGRIYAESELRGRLCIGRVTRADADAYGLRDGDLEGVVEALLQVQGPDGPMAVAALVFERADGTIKHSLRSGGAVDVAALAASLSPTGGGHAKAAGAVVSGPLEAAIDALSDAVARALDRP